MNQLKHMRKRVREVEAIIDAMETVLSSMTTELEVLEKLSRGEKVNYAPVPIPSEADLPGRALCDERCQDPRTFTPLPDGFPWEYDGQ